MTDIKRLAVSALIKSGLLGEEATVLFDKSVEAYRRGNPLPEEVRDRIKPLTDGTWLAGG